MLGKITLYAQTETGYKNLTKVILIKLFKKKETDDPSCEIKDLISITDIILLTEIIEIFWKLFQANKINF